MEEHGVLLVETVSAPMDLAVTFTIVPLPAPAASTSACPSSLVKVRKPRDWESERTAIEVVPMLSVDVGNSVDEDRYRPADFYKKNASRIATWLL